jgi:thiol-disulfide isomerase/thioredoxin
MMLARIGGILVAPRATLARAVDAPDGQGTRDITLLLAVRLVAGELPGIVRAILRGKQLGLAVGFTSFMTLIAQILPDLLAITAAGLVLQWVRRGHSDERKASAFDIAGYAWVPYFALQMAAATAIGVAAFAGATVPPWVRTATTFVAVGWSLAIFVLALVARPADTEPRGSAIGVTLFGVAALLTALQVVVIQQSWLQIVGNATPIGSGAPAIDLQLLDGGRFKLSEAQGRPVLLDFWATWCGPCRDELPAIQALATRYPEAKIVAVNVEGSGARDRIKAFAHANQLTLPIAVDDGSAAAAYRIEVLPHTVVLDDKGRVHKIFIGAQSASTLESALQTAISH